MKRALALSTVISLVAACGTSASSQYALDVGGDDAGNVNLAAGDAASTQGLDAYIEQGAIAVKLITLSCAGECATVQAMGTGGNPPYSFAWENGSTNPVRQVCPNSSTSYSVKVTDKGATGEVPRPSQTAKASVTADVLACPDGGPSDAASPGVPLDACVGGFVNPSIEGTPQTAVIGLWDATGWNQCPWLGLYPTYLANQTTNPGTGPAGGGIVYPPPTDGRTYAVIQTQGVDAGALPNEGFGQQLCTPASAGTSFRLDAMWIDPSQANGGAGDPAGTQVSLQVFGGATACTESTLLWSSPPLTKTWGTYCVTMGQATPSVTFNGAISDASASAFVLVDHIVPVASCP